MPLGHFQIRNQKTVIQCGGRLADTAAVSIHGLTANVGGRGLVALLGGTLTQGCVIAEFFTGIEDRTIQSLTGQPQVGSAVITAPLVGFIGSKHISEEHTLQRFRIHFGKCFRKGELQYIAGFCGSQNLLGIF